MSANKIELSFDNFEQVEQRLQHLLDAGYRQQGNWNLAQTASHLNDWLIYPITGYPKPALPTRMVLGILKITSGRRLLKKTLASGFRSGGGMQQNSSPAMAGVFVCRLCRIVYS